MQVVGFVSEVPGSEVPGYSIDQAQWDKAKRMEDPKYDWQGYTKIIRDSLFDHPELAHREHDAAVKAEWDALLRELEPYNPRGI